jgi:hypothetical protein
VESESEESDSDPEADPGYGGSSPIHAESESDEGEGHPQPLDPIPEEPEQVLEPDQVPEAVEPAVEKEGAQAEDTPEVRFNMNILDFYQVSCELKEALAWAESPEKIKEIKEQARIAVTPIRKKNTWRIPN